MPDTIEIRQLTTIKEMHLVQDLEKSIWQMSPIPIHQTFTASKNGGIILGAFSDETLVGFIYSFAGFNGKDVHLCSHMHGILPEYRKGGLGVKLKLKQAELALEKGYELITWTFDPLESLNAYLNIHKLGAVGAFYKENYYGSMDDELNKGLPTDRLLVEWHINKKQSLVKHSLNEKKVLLGISKDNAPLITVAMSKNSINEKEPWFVAIPENFQTMKGEDSELAKEWRYETRKIFNVLFANGYHAADVVRNRSKQTSYYLFTK